jgi:hypothetical protein
MPEVIKTFDHLLDLLLQKVTPHKPVAMHTAREPTPPHPIDEFCSLALCCLRMNQPCRLLMRARRLFPPLVPGGIDRNMIRPVVYEGIVRMLKE